MTPPTPEAIRAGQELVFDAIAEFADLAGSYCRSAVEAADRRERTILKLHLQQLRATVIATIEQFKDLPE